jgi:hypothetical protein
LAALGVSLHLADGQLRARGPVAVVEDAMPALRQRRGEFAAYLRRIAALREANS